MACLNDILIMFQKKKKRYISIPRRQYEWKNLFGTVEPNNSSEYVTLIPQLLPSQRANLKLHEDLVICWQKKAIYMNLKRSKDWWIWYISWLVRSWMNSHISNEMRFTMTHLSTSQYISLLVRSWTHTSVIKTWLTTVEPNDLSERYINNVSKKKKGWTHTSVMKRGSQQLVWILINTFCY